MRCVPYLFDVRRGFGLCCLSLFWYNYVWFFFLSFFLICVLCSSSSLINKEKKYVCRSYRIALSCGYWCLVCCCGPMLLLASAAPLHTPCISVYINIAESRPFRLLSSAKTAATNIILLHGFWSILIKPAHSINKMVTKLDWRRVLFWHGGRWLCGVRATVVGRVAKEMAATLASLLAHSFTQFNKINRFYSSTISNKALRET